MELGEKGDQTMTLNKETLDELKKELPSDAFCGIPWRSVPLSILAALIASAEELDTAKAIIASTQAGDAMLLDNLERHLGKRPETIAEGIEQVAEQLAKLNLAKDHMDCCRAKAGVPDDDTLAVWIDELVKERDAWKADADTLAITCVIARCSGDFSMNEDALQSIEESLEAHNKLMNPEPEEPND